MPPPNVTVFCASSNHVGDGFMKLADGFGRLLADKGCTLVYGGGNVGLMGVLARSVHANGGRVVGVIPHALREIEGVAYETADELILTDTMRERKRIMYERADAFVALPGGLGTLEEFLEVVTLRKLGYHDRPIYLVNPDGFFDGLLGFFDTLVERRFSKPAERHLFETVHDAAAVFETVSFRALMGT
jgi:hypothetical protein